MQVCLREVVTPEPSKLTKIQRALASAPEQFFCSNAASRQPRSFLSDAMTFEYLRLRMVCS